MTKSDRSRGAGRITLSRSVDATVGGFPKPVSVTLIDLSQAGCRLTAGSVLLVGSTIEFALPANGRPRVLHGAIRRCIPTSSSGTLEYGVEFSALPAEDVEALRAFIDEESRRAGPDSATRIEVEFPVGCTVAGTKAIVQTVAIDLGRGGMRIASDLPFSEGSTLTLRFALPNGAETTEFVMHGRVVQRKPFLREHHHNVAFINPDPASLQGIDRYIQTIQ